MFSTAYTAATMTLELNLGGISICSSAVDLSAANTMLVGGPFFNSVGNIKKSGSLSLSGRDINGMALPDLNAGNTSGYDGYTVSGMDFGYDLTASELAMFN